MFMPSIGIEPSTSRSLTRRSTQLSYAATKIIIICCTSKHFLEKRIHNRKQSFVMHMHKIVSLFKKIDAKIQQFLLQNNKKLLSGWGLWPRLPVFLYYSRTVLLKNTRRLSCMFLNEVIKLCDQLCFSYLKIQVV